MIIVNLNVPLIFTTPHLSLISQECTAKLDFGYHSSGPKIEPYGTIKKVVFSMPVAGRLTAQLACRQYYRNGNVIGCFK